MIVCIQLACSEYCYSFAFFIIISEKKVVLLRKYFFFKKVEQSWWHNNKTKWEVLYCKIACLLTLKGSFCSSFCTPQKDITRFEVKSKSAIYHFRHMRRLCTTEEKTTPQIRIWNYIEVGRQRNITGLCSYCVPENQTIRKWTW